MIGGVLGMGRRMAEARMTETVTVGRFEQRRPPGSLDSVLTLVEIFYTGRARVKYPSASAATKTPGDQQLVETTIVLSLPVSSVPVLTGALCRVESSSADDALPGRLFRIEGPAQAGQTTAHRYPVVEES